MIFIGAIILGVALGIIIPYNLTSDTLPYVAVALIAALDSVVGASASYLNKKFNMNIFLTGLISNAILAVLITHLGNLLGISMYFAVIVVFGVRIFNNMAAIRRTTLDIYFVKKTREQNRKKYLALSEGVGVFDEDEEEENAEESETLKDEKAEEAESEVEKNDGEDIKEQ